MNSSIKRAVVLCLVVLCFTGISCEKKSGHKKLTIEKKNELIDKLEKHFVVVEFYLKYDKSKAPQIHHNASSLTSDSGKELVDQERPLEISGIVIADDTVITPDPIIEEKFIKEIKIRKGDKTVTAEISAYTHQADALFLKLKGKLEGIVPAVFKDVETKDENYLSMHHSESMGKVKSYLHYSGMTLKRFDDGTKFRTPTFSGLVVTPEGQPVTISTKREFDLDENWRISPLNWNKYSADEYKNMIANFKKLAEKSVLRCKINLRSPKKNSMDMFSRMYSRMSEDGKSATRIDVPGLLIDKGRIAILAKLDPKVTARIQKITVYDKDNKSHKAVFEGTFKDYGAFTAKLDEPLEGSVVLNDKDIRDSRKTMLLLLDVSIHGDKRVAKVRRCRFSGFEKGWKSIIFPEVGEDYDYDEGKKSLFVFNPKNEILCVKIPRRKKIREESSRYSFSDGDSAMFPVGHLKGVFADLAANFDPDNVPLSEQESQRVAWMGVVLQPLNKELARLNKVSEASRNGKIGGLVSYIYPGSPAEKLGIEQGMVLMRIHTPESPKPIDVEIDKNFSMFQESFPWDKLSMIPPQYLDKIPPPWPAVENPFNRMITDIGFGKKFQAELYQDGKKVMKQFTVTKSPTHYGSAPRFKSKDIRLTVRDMTYEVRFYFHKKPEDEGVIVSKVENGGKAFVAGIRPFEIITHVNGQPVYTVKDFEELIKEPQELRLSVKRKMKGRVVNIRLKRKPKPKESTTKPEKE